MSVSRVVNGTRRVSPDVERRVRAAIERIGYVPNEAARILKGNRGSVLGLIVPDLADQFFSTCCSAIQEAAWDAGYMTLMAASNHREQLERQETALMVQRRVAGLLVVPIGAQNDHFIAAQEAGVPVVAIDRPIEHVDSDTLTVDNLEASFGATRHLIAHGHREILCVADDERMIPEEWGGDTMMVELSALQGLGVDDLLEAILLLADNDEDLLEELQANPKAPAQAVVLEGHLDVGRGPMATVLIQQGTLRVGDPVVAGAAWGRVRALLDDKGQRLTEAGPSTPVVVLGFDEVPGAGDDLRVAPDDKVARTVATARVAASPPGRPVGHGGRSTAAGPSWRTSSPTSSGARSPR